MKMKTVTKRHGPENHIRDIGILLRTMNRLRNFALIPKGLYKFKTFTESNTWMTHQIASTHARLNSKT